MNDLNNYLIEVIESLDRGRMTFTYTFEKCKSYPIDEHLDMEQMDDFEALCSKFVRLSDIIIKKVMRVIDVVEFENPDKTVIDTIGAMAKRGFVSEEKSFYAIRDIRNTISHEYMLSSSDLIVLYRSVLDYSTELLTCSTRILDYVKKKGYLAI